MKKLTFTLVAALGLAASASAQNLVEAARLVDIERYGDAGRAFKKIVAAAPTADNYFYYGYALAVAEKPDSAIMMWTTGASKDAKSALGHVGLGSAEILKGNVAGAKPHFDEALKISKNKNSEVIYRIGQAYTIYPKKDIAEAVNHLNKAGQIDKGRPDIMVTLGNAYLLKGDGTAAADAYDAAIRRNPNYTEAYIRSGQVYERARSFKVAYDRYMEGMKRDSSYTPGFRYLAELQRKAKQPTQAIVNYRKYIQRSDRNPEALVRFAGFLIEQGQYQEAQQYLTEAEGKTKSPLFNRLKAYSLYETGDAAAAEQALTQFISTVDTSKIRIIGRDYFYLGKAALATSKDTAKGFGLMQQGLAMDSNLTEDVKQLGDSAFAVKNYKLATRYRQLYVKNAGKPSPNDYFALGQAAFFGKEFMVADTAFDMVTKVSEGRSPTGLFYRGYTWQSLDAEGKTGNASKYFGEFISVTLDSSKVPLADQPKFAKQRATAYAFIGRELAVNKKDYKEAERYAELSLKEDPTNKQAAQLKQGIEQMKKQPKAAAPAPKAAPKKK